MCRWVSSRLEVDIVFSTRPIIYLFIYLLPVDQIVNFPLKWDEYSLSNVMLMIYDNITRFYY